MRTQLQIAITARIMMIIVMLRVANVFTAITIMIYIIMNYDDSQHDDENVNDNGIDSAHDNDNDDVETGSQRIKDRM